VVSISLGAADVPILTVAKSLLGWEVPRRHDVIILNIRLPQALAGMVAGAGLALSGAVTITSPMMTLTSALLSSMLAAGVIVLISRARGATPEVMVLTAFMGAPVFIYLIIEGQRR
jgi:iron complex transport system permease protein